MKYLFPLLAIVAIALTFWIFKQPKELDLSTFLKEEEAVLKIPLGLPEMPWPKDNSYSKAKAELGRLLYFDKRLSSDGSVSCATCHTTDLAFTDGKKISIGIEGKQGTRNAPTVINAGYQKHQFWDGRANTLEEQCKGPIANPNEMTLEDNAHAAHLKCQERVMGIPGYKKFFGAVFQCEGCTLDDIAKAIATFERTVVSGNSPYDRYITSQNKSHLSAEALHGYAVFKKVGCANCHAEPLFTDGRFLNIGVGMDQANPDLGRYIITKEEKDWGAFKVPTLRDVEHTAPYMHDGSLISLEEVVDYYDKGGIPNKNLHPLMKPLKLTDQDKKDLVSFMKALSGEGWQHFTAPKAFP